MRVLIAGLTLLLAACGFQPMYAQPGGGAAIGPVNVEQIDGKAGHVLKIELDRILAVENDGSPAMVLEVRLSERIRRLGLRVDESASRAELRLTANYVPVRRPAGASAARSSLS